MPESKSGALTNLATPQWFKFTKRMPLAPPRDKSAPRAGQLAEHALRLCLRREFCKHARPRSGHPRLRPPRAQPREVRRNLRAAPHGRGFEIVPAQAGEKGRYFESFRITCQRVIGEYIARGKHHRRQQHETPS